LGSFIEIVGNLFMSYHVIVGGGLAGLFVAKRLLNKGTKKIIIIEKNKNLGGLLKK